jgi:ankyrin repeat protein
MRTGKTALQIAAFEGRPKALEILLEKGASHSRRTKEGWTALHFVPFEVVSSDCAKILLQHGADINAQTNHGKTTLDFAVEMGERQLCEFLREHGATGSTATDEEDFPMHEKVPGPRSLNLNEFHPRIPKI